MTDQSGFYIHRDLVDRCRKGDRVAQNELYRLYYKAMYNTSLRILNDPQEAEDAMQEAFLAAFMKINSYRGELTFGAWLKRIVINKSIDALRQKKVKFEAINENLGIENEVDSGDDTFAVDEAYRTIERIKEAVKKLPEGFRVVLSLSLFEGYDHEEIAQILGISESTSRSQLARAKKKLVEFLNKRENETT
jgi:RNA polymerase sigma-70 factor (ECF subfamily)